MILIAGDAAGMHYFVLVLLTFIFVLPASYLAHAWWSFTVHATWGAFLRYVAGSLASLAIAATVIGLLRGGLSLPMVVVAPLATIVMILYNYLMARWAVLHGQSRYRVVRTT